MGSPGTPTTVTISPPAAQPTCRTAPLALPGWGRGGRGTTRAPLRRSRQPRTHRRQFQERLSELGAKALPGPSPSPPPGARRGPALPGALMEEEGSHWASPEAATGREGQSPALFARSGGRAAEAAGTQLTADRHYHRLPASQPASPARPPLPARWAASPTAASRYPRTAGTSSA